MGKEDEDSRPSFVVDSDMKPQGVDPAQTVSIEVVQRERAETLTNDSPHEFPEAPRPEPGIVLAGKYRIDEPLGSGGMGQVFRGEHLLLHLPIAVKVLHPFVASDPHHKRRFQREARAAAMLDHPNVVRVLDFGQHGSTVFIVMDYIEGRSLDMWLDGRNGLPPIAEVVDIALQLLSALEAAHALGIVHRDLKPENVLLTPGPQGRLIAKIVDFGLAHVEDPADKGPTLTKSDAIAGTPTYMSPEQCRSLAVGPSTDLYALGCLLTTMLQGDPPFDGMAAMDVIAKQMFVPAPPLRRRDDDEPVPPLLERLRLSLLAKQPHDRPPDAAATAALLREAVSPEAHAEKLPTRKGDLPLGGRESRAPAWEGSERPPRPEASTELLLTVVATGKQPGGWDESASTGLAALDMLAKTVGDVNEVEPGYGPVVVVDAGQHLDQALVALKTLKQRDPEVAVVICLEGLTSQRMNKLIEAGAADVLRYPVASDKLAKKIRRAARRH